MRKAELEDKEEAALAAKILIMKGGDAYAIGSALLYEHIEIPSWIPHENADWTITDYDRHLFYTNWG